MVELLRNRRTMHRFTYKNNQLYCENVPISDIARRFRTPFYLYSHRTLIDHYTKIKNAFRSVKPLICFSMKANSNLAVLKTLTSRGAGLDVVSGGELYKALKVGCPAERIVYASVGKRPEEIKEAIQRGILLFNVESLAELEMINDIAHSLKKRPSVAVRLNPDVGVKAHKYVTTGKKENKFGVDFDTAEYIFDASSGFSNIKISGLHVHIGSQITEPVPFIGAIKKVLDFIDSFKISIDWLNIGGGLGIVYSDEKPQTAAQFAKKVLPYLKGRPFKIILEPGRFIAGPSGILVTKVLYTKKNPSGKRFAIVDAGMNDLLRPSLYGAYHEILPASRKPKAESRKLRYDIVGPICETGDFLAQNRSFRELKAGDLLAVMGAGAYGFTMASNYNSRPRVAEIMVIKGKAYIVKKAESHKDLVRGEIIPKGI